MKRVTKSILVAIAITSVMVAFAGCSKKSAAGNSADKKTLTYSR